MEQPTEAQIKKFWERCGFCHKKCPEPITEYPDFKHKGEYSRCPFGGGNHVHLNYPDGSVRFNTTGQWVPPIDLNNLFKYAVPKAIDKIMAEQECSSDLAYSILFKKWLQKLECDIPNHARTLFWAIWQVKEQGTKQGKALNVYSNRIQAR
ncbi:MAG: hypothetical protein V3U84_12510 [Thiotrichaceae bacterium]